jgi:hypothetical protein
MDQASDSASMKSTSTFFSLKPFVKRSKIDSLKKATALAKVGKLRQEHKLRAEAIFAYLSMR